MRKQTVRNNPNLNRFLQTIDAFRAEHDAWPTEIVLGKEPYRILMDECFSPTTWKLVEDKLRIILCTGFIFVALDDDGRVSVYNWDYTNEGLSASEWLGIAREKV